MEVIDKYISDGDTLYKIKDMAGILAAPKLDLEEIYVYTRYHLQFEEALREMINLGIVEVADNRGDNRNDFPFDGVSQTLIEIRQSGVFSTEELKALDQRVLNYFEVPTADAADNNE